MSDMNSLTTENTSTFLEVLQTGVTHSTTENTSTFLERLQTGVIVVVKAHRNV